MHNWPHGRWSSLLEVDIMKASPTVFQHFHGKPEEDEGVDQGIDAVTPENLQEDKPGDQSIQGSNLCV